jgi:hypothetical protein
MLIMVFDVDAQIEIKTNFIQSWRTTFFFLNQISFASLSYQNFILPLSQSKRHSFGRYGCIDLDAF